MSWKGTLAIIVAVVVFLYALIFWVLPNLGILIFEGLRLQFQAWLDSLDLANLNPPPSGNDPGGQMTTWLDDLYSAIGQATDNVFQAFSGLLAGAQQMWWSIFGPPA